MEKKRSAQDVWQSTEGEEHLLPEGVSDRMWIEVDRKFKWYRRGRVIKMGGMLALIPVLGLLVLQRMQAVQINSQVLVYQTDLNRDTVRLADGTLVYLDVQSKLTVSADFGQSSRHVSFGGHAYFDVAKNKEKPFVVEALDFSVEVLGTKFYLSSVPSDQKVELVEGKVKVQKGNEPYYLLANEVWSYSVGEGEQRYLMASAEQTFSFDKTDFKDVVDELERRYHVKIGYPEEYKGRKVSGEFNGNLEAILKIVAFPFDLDIYSMNKHEIVLK